MRIEDYKTLPEEVQAFIWDSVSDFNDKIYKEFDLETEQFDYINQLEDNIILKKTQVIDLPVLLSKMPGQLKGDVRKLALDMAIRVFWPLNEYLGGVDKLILRLGGKIPSAVSLVKNKKISKDGPLPGKFTGRVKDLIKKNKDFKNLRLSPNKIVNKDGRSVAPTVINWLEDYIHFLGAGKHSSLDKVKYLSKSENVLKLSEKYKDNLRSFLLSYDQGIKLSFYKSAGILMVDKHIEEYKNKQVKQEEVDTDFTLNEFHKNILNLENNILSEDIIMSEVENDIQKVPDVLWKAIGIGDKDKAISCIKILIEKKSFDLMIKDDSRFKNILKRFIGVKYGQNMEKSVDLDIDKLIVRRIFLEMLLSDKLRFSEQEVFVVAFYLSNILPDSGQLIYLDKSDQKFKWRTIQVSGNKFVWVDKI